MIKTVLRKKTILIIVITVLTMTELFALTHCFASESYSTRFEKKVIFQFVLNIDSEDTEIGPGESTVLNSNIYNDGTENMYAFIVMTMPFINEVPLYTYEVDGEWKLINTSGNSFIYAYAGDEMTILFPGEITTDLTRKLTMQSISNAEYACIDDINVSIVAYTVGTDDMPTNPQEVWIICKSIGNIEL